jgi:hypothetical protein
VSDLLSALGDSADVEILLLGQGRLKKIGRFFVGNEVDDFSSLQSRSGSPKEYEALIRFLSKTLAYFMRDVQANLFITGNFTYWMMHPLGSALKLCGVPLAVVHKEGLVSSWQPVADGYRRIVSNGVGPTTASRIAVHSDATRQLIAKSGVASVDVIEVIGAARLDSCHVFRTSRSRDVSSDSPPTVTFFTFPLTIGLWFPSDPVGRTQAPQALRSGWRNLLEETLRAADEVARRNPNLSVVVKSKSEPARDPFVMTLLDGLVESSPPNLSVIRSGEGQKHVLGSEAVVAFNSTIILEAIASGTPVLVPAFAEAAEEEANPHLLQLGRSVTLCRSRDELVARLGHFESGGSTGSTRKVDLTDDETRVLEVLAGNPDGDSSARLRDFLDRVSRGEERLHHGD